MSPCRPTARVGAFDRSRTPLGAIERWLIGSIRETQEVLDFWAEHGIAPNVEAIPIQGVNDAYKRVKSGDVRFRNVIDMASLKREMADAA